MSLCQKEAGQIAALGYAVAITSLLLMGFDGRLVAWAFLADG